MADSILQPLINQVVHNPDHLRQVLVDWMAAAWIRGFDPEEALDLAQDVVSQYPLSFIGQMHGAELVTRALWRVEMLYKMPNAEQAAQVLMDLMLNVDERYLRSLDTLNDPITDGEG